LTSQTFSTCIISSAHSARNNFIWGFSIVLLKVVDAQIERREQVQVLLNRWRLAGDKSGGRKILLHATVEKINSVEKTAAK